MKKQIKKALAVSAFAVVATVGMAQVPGVSGLSGTSFRIGVAYPTDSAAKDIGKNWKALGLDYKLSNFQLKVPGVGMSTYLAISADYFNHGSSSDFPLALTYNLRTLDFVFGAGIGADFYNLENGGGSGTALNLQASVSYDVFKIPTPIFVQAKYFMSEKKELRTFGLYVGVRF